MGERALVRVCRKGEEWPLWLRIRVLGLGQAEGSIDRIRLLALSLDWETFGLDL
jgi:hypothetical protein